MNFCEPRQKREERPFCAGTSCATAGLWPVVTRTLSTLQKFPDFFEMQCWQPCYQCTPRTSLRTYTLLCEVMAPCYQMYLNSKQQSLTLYYCLCFAITNVSLVAKYFLPCLALNFNRYKYYNDVWLYNGTSYTSSITDF